MKIKLAFLEKDAGYLNRIVNVFGARYSENFQIYSFTDVDVAMSTIETAKIEVLVASDSFEIDVSKLPKRCGFSYFVDSPDVEMLNGQRAICKFQKAELIYKQILSLYSENAENVFGLKFGDDSSKILIFQPISGGCGASSVAAACAVHYAAEGKKTLYLNLERFGSADSFFSADGQFDMSDLVYALKSKKSNLAMKLESCVKQASNGVYFFSETKIALDMIELSSEDIIRLISELQLTGTYDYIIIDMDFSIEKGVLNICRKAHSIVWVGDGSAISNTKLCRALDALNIIEDKADAPIPRRLNLIYNKFSNKTSKVVDGMGIANAGGAPRFEHATTAQVVDQLSKMDFFKNII